MPQSARLSEGGGEGVQSLFGQCPNRRGIFLTGASPTDIDCRIRKKSGDATLQSITLEGECLSAWWEFAAGLFETFHLSGSTIHRNDNDDSS